MPSDPPVTRCGTIALAGRPNAGKSTLLNALVGEPLAITSAKPQTTRVPVVGLRTEGNAQLIFVDPAGLLDPRYLMQHAMLDEATDALKHADAVLYLHPAPEAPAPTLESLLPQGTRVRGPVLTVLTKADLVTQPPTKLPPDTLLVSAVTGKEIGALVRWCAAQMPPGPFRHDAEALSTQPLRFFVAEFVREAAFESLGAELPYALAAEVDEFREGSTPVYIRVVLHVERESQKGMVVGKGGRTIKQIGTHARRRIEALLGAPVYLELWVKQLPKWRSRAGPLRRLGFQVPPSRSP